jgi:transcriptional regulator with AAA-type ATPase domain/tetratricopeptide (TPR) repeat protein
MAVGNLGDAMEFYRKALDRAPVEGKKSLVEAALRVSACLRRQGKAGEALAFVESVAGPDMESAERDLVVERARLLTIKGRYGEAARACEKVLESEPDPERSRDAGTYLVLGHVLARLCRWREAILCLEQAATFGRMCGDLRVLGKALNNLGIVYKNLCRFEESARYLKKAVRAAREAHDEASLAVRLLNLGVTRFKQGRLGRARRRSEEAVRVASSLSIERTHLLASILLVRIEVACGHIRQARASLEDLRTALQGSEDPRVQALASETQADILLSAGDPRAAVPLLQRALIDLTPEAGDVEAELKTRLAEACLESGQTADARRHAASAAHKAEITGDLYEAARALRLLAGAEPGRAAEYLGRAETIQRKIGALLELVRTLRAKQALKTVGPAEGIAALEEALSIARNGNLEAEAFTLETDLAGALASSGRHQEALHALSKASEAVAGCPRRRSRHLEARRRVDVCLSRSLSRELPARPSSPPEVFAMLGDRLGTEALILGEVTGETCYRAVRSSGVSPHSAELLMKALAGREGNVFVATDLPGLVEDRAASRLGAAFGMRFGGGRGIVIACWGGGGSGGRRGPGPSTLLSARYEIAGVIPVLERELSLPSHGFKPVSICGMVTADAGLAETLLGLRRIARTPASVLITGETGTGKELVARAVHLLSERRHRPFVVQNCAALPEQLLESEFFGYRAGAFTGARGDKRGLLEAAGGGTFFLDEIGEINVGLQAKLLRAIETGEVRRVGDTTTRTVSARFVSATNKDLEEEVEAGRFRRDLFYRLNLVTIRLPALRDRRCDIPVLARLFAARQAASLGRKPPALSEGVLQVLRAYDWPGNVRQLENEIGKAVTMARPGETLTAGMLSDSVRGSADGREPVSLKEELREVEHRRILRALRRTGWNKTHAARLLGDISRPALIARMKRLGIPLRPPES